MLAIPGYRILEKIYESHHSMAFRGQREQDNLAVVLKMLKGDYPPPAELARYRREFEIATSLGHLPCVVKPLALIPYHHTIVIVFEDIGSDSLRVCMKKRKFSLDESLMVAIRITESLGLLHSANVIHKDINPANVLVHPKNLDVKVIDFGLSSFLPKEDPSADHLHRLEGTPAYIAPEQTGKINREVDYRADYYSLGALFYEMFAGRLPFVERESQRLIHCHIAKKPQPLNELCAEVPEVLSDVVLKLMAKVPEDRYQSTRGIRADLEECLNQLRAAGQVDTFPIATQDVAEKLIIPQRLFGREAEIATLLEKIDTVSQGHRQLLVISGPSGYGKTSLVKEVYQPLTMMAGYFVSGKFDQMQRETPYAGLMDGFRHLVKQLLTEPEEVLQHWVEKLSPALGISGRVIAEVIPEIEMIIGPQPPLPDSSAGERQGRFNRIFEKFVGVFAQKEHPLVIFMDDLQWADSASLQLIRLFLTSPEIHCLLFIGTCRNNEVGEGHPWLQIQEEIRKSDCEVVAMPLRPLELEHVNQLVSQVTHRAPEATEPLASLILSRTEGNPFFIDAFIYALYTEGLLHLDQVKGVWEWDLERIRAKGITDNVADLMVARIRKLEPATQELLKVAAGLGSQFDMESLAQVSDQKILDTIWALRPAAVAGLIIPLGRAYRIMDQKEFLESSGAEIEFKFAHDRILQAAYSQNSESELPFLHRKIGNLLLKNLPPEKRDVKLFDIVNHLNLGAAVLESQTERDALARLNLEVAQKAKSVAFEQALKYLVQGCRLLGDNAWERDHDLAFALKEERMEVAYLTGDFEQMERWSDEVLKHGASEQQKIKTYRIILDAFTAQTKLNVVLDQGLSVLGRLGVSLPRSPERLQLALERLKTRFTLLGRRIEDLADLATMSDPRLIAAIQIMRGMSIAAYVSNPRLFALMVFRQIRQVIRHGLPAHSSSLFAAYGSVLCGQFGDIETGCRVGRLALQLAETPREKAEKSRVQALAHSFILHWEQHLARSLKPFWDGCQAGMESGDISHAAFDRHMIGHHSYFLGKQLSVLERELSENSQELSRLRQEIPLRYNEIFHQVVLNLQGLTEDPCRLLGPLIDERTAIPQLEKADERTGLFLLHYHKLSLCCLFGRYAQAVELADLLIDRRDAVAGLFCLTREIFFDSLARLNVWLQTSRSEQKRILQIVGANQQKLRKWSDHAPMNHLHLYWLIEAEKSRVLGQHQRVQELYDKAVALSRQNGYPNEEALIQELAGQYYLAQDKEPLYKAYLKDAHYAYLKWGAQAKVKDLTRRHRFLIDQ